MTFPKTIHQIWLQGKDRIPDKFLPNIDKIKRYHKTWNYILWDDVMIIKLLRMNKTWIDVYYKLTFLHQKVDYARYIILYVFGGVYIDIDVMILKPFDTLIDKFKNYDLIVSRVNLNRVESIIYSGKYMCINNGIIISKRRTNIMRKIIEQVNNNHSCKILSMKFHCISNTTGPNMFTDIILKNAGEKIKILDPQYLEPQILGTGGITQDTYAIHHHEGSWLDKRIKSLAILYFKNKKLFVTATVLILLLIILILSRII